MYYVNKAIQSIHLQANINLKMEGKLKRNKYFIVLAILLVSLTTLASCVPPTSSAATTPTISPITQVQTDVASLKSDIASLRSEKAPNSSVTTLESRLSTVEGKIGALQGQGPGNSYAKTETYTKAEIDAAIALLKSNQSWITTSTSSGGTSSTTGTTPITGQVTYSLNPTAISPISSWTSSNPVFYTIHVMNGTSTWQYVKPIINLSLINTSVQPQLISLSISLSSMGCNISQNFLANDTIYATGYYNSGTGYTGTCNKTTPCFSYPTQISISPLSYGSDPATASIVIMPMAGCSGTGEFSVGPGQATDILVSISNMGTTSAATWTISNSITSRNMY